MNGLSAQFEYLEKLIKDQDPEMMCIQETNFKDNSSINIKKFTIYHKNRTNAIVASGGVATYIQNKYFSKEIKLNTTLEAVAVTVLLSAKRICICNLYI